MQKAFSLLENASSGVNRTFTALANVTNITQAGRTAAVPFFPSGLSALAMIAHLATHPKIKDWLQLLALGLIATFSRMASKHVNRWLRQIFCTTSVHLMNDESYDWLMGEYL
jgi:hypothetical protein